VALMLALAVCLARAEDGETLSKKKADIMARHHHHMGGPVIDRKPQCWGKELVGLDAAEAKARIEADPRGSRVVKTFEILDAEALAGVDKRYGAGARNWVRRSRVRVSASQGAALSALTPPLTRPP